ncbi:MAG: DUF6017 domain-containing protein [Blautia sp.]|uniref:DUF6017 domain-containing protein n=1 Tax=Blautia sp. TaxID=1955243 RepID=UPI002A7EA5E5|nr:DUF6017 domain-containing protein [Blautia sp.]MCI5962021.1 replication initiator protein A [Clostridia bacterium]MDY4055817.1 DUF6017 domain-containing protein [Blautia sp.]
MEQKVSFDYFYGTQADQYSFYRIPKALFQNDYFKNLSSDAKILYGLMLDRMSLSIKNQWFDEQNRAYIYFSIEDIMELLNCGKNKAIKSLQELDQENGIGLIEKKRQGFGKTNIIYVKSFVIPDKKIAVQEDLPGTSQKFEIQTADEKEDATEVCKTNFKKSQKQTSRSLENKLQEVCKTNSIYNNLSYNKENDTESDLIGSSQMRSTEGMTTMQAYGSLIKENIDYDNLLITHPFEQELIQGIYELILETVLCQNEEILIASNWYPVRLVKSKFLKLKYSHIEYVIECLKKNTSKVKNIKKYMLAALFNAPTTIDGYYQAEVNHDMPQFA